MVLIKCACPCKTLFEENDKYGRKRRYINGHQRKGITRTQEFKNKMSVIMKGKFKGKHFSPKTEFKKGIIPWNKGKNNVFSEEAILKMRKSHKGKSTWNKGLILKPLSEKHKLKISLATKGGNKTSFRKGKYNPHQFKSLDKHPNWRGGTSFEPYSIEWNKELKFNIRQRDNFECQECHFSEKELNYNLHIHHIDYDKKNCQNNNLISLCHSCHGKTLWNKEKWIKYYQSKIKKITGVFSCS